MAWRLDKHYEFCKRMTGVSVTLVSLWKRSIGWLVPPHNNTVRWSFTVLAGH